MKRGLRTQRGYSAAVALLRVAIALLALAERTGRAEPVGQTVVAGHAIFERQGPLTTIHAGHNSIINYRSFDIHAQETVQFIQPHSSSRVLNRVAGDAPTGILGNLFANGQVYIANPAGIHFGKNSYINVGGLVAAAGHISDQDFLNGINRFSRLSGDVSNLGTIEAGSVTLAGQHVANHGNITARNGLVTLLAGDEVLVGETGGRVFVNLGKASSDETAGVENTGTINAGTGRSILAAGDLYSLAVVNSGEIHAREITLEGKGSGIVHASGKLNASDRSPGRKGGRVHVLGEKVALTGATIDASGDAGGGTVLIGGDYQGKGDVRNASQTLVDRDSTITSDAISRGDGGKVVVWSDHTTEFYGTISAQALGPTGGGGLAEISGKQHLALSGHANLSGANGAKGQLLVDPGSVVIRGGPDEAPTPLLDTFTDSWIINQLNAGGADLTISTANSANGNVEDLVVDDSVNLIYNSANDFNLVGNNSLTVNGQIENLGSGSVTFTSTGDIRFNENVTAESVIAHSGTDGTGDISFSQGIRISADTQMYRAGDGTGGDANAKVNLSTSAALFRNRSDGQTEPLTFIHRQDAQITELDLAAPAQFGGVPPASYTLQSDDGSITVGMSVSGTNVTGRAVSLALFAANDITFASGISIVARSLNAHSGTDGSGDVAFRNNVIINADTQLYRAGDGPGGAGNDAAVKLNFFDPDRSTPKFLNTDTSPGPMSFMHRQDAGIANSDIANIIQFGGVAPIAYSIQSDAGAVALATASKVRGSALTLSAASTLTIDREPDTVSPFELSLASLDASGASIVLRRPGTAAIPSVQATTGSQTYNDPVTLGADTILTGIGVAFASTVDRDSVAARHLTVNAGTGSASFAGNMGAGANGTLGALTVNSSDLTTFAGAVNAASLTTDVPGRTDLNGGLITTTGSQTYNDPVTLTVDTTLTGTTLDLAAVNSGGNDLTLNNGALATLSGAITGVDQFNATGSGTLSVNNTISAGSVNVTEAATLSGGTVTTTAGQTYGNTVTLGADTILTETTLELAAVNGSGNNLTLNNSAEATLNGAVTAVDQFNATGSGTLSVNNTISAGSVNVTEAATLSGGTVTTTAGQTYGGTIMLGAGTTLTGTTLDLAAINGGGNNLTLNNSGPASLNGAVTAVDQFNATGSGALAVNNTISAGSVNVTEEATLSGGTVTTVAGQTYGNTVTLGADTILTGIGVTFGSTVDSDSVAARNLTVNAGTGAASFAGNIGAGANGALGDLSVNGSDITSFEGTINAASLATDALGTTDLNGGLVNTTGSQTYNNPVTLTADTTLAGTGVAFNSTVDSDGVAARSLTVNAGTGAATFAGPIGAGVTGALGALAVNSSDLTSFEGTVNAASLTTDAPGSSIVSEKLRADSITLNDLAMLAATGTPSDASVLTSGDQTYRGREGRFRLGTDTTGSEDIVLQSTGGAIQFNPDGNTLNSASATIYKTSPGNVTIQANNFVMGQNEKFVSTGGDSIIINAGQSVRLSDIAVLGRLIVNSPNITLLPRQPIVDQPADRGLDFVATTISVGPGVPTFDDPGQTVERIAIFGTTESLADVAVTEGIIRVLIEPPPPFVPEFDMHGIPVDPRAPVPVNISEALGLIEPVPAEEAPTVLISPAFTSHEQVFSRIYLLVFYLQNTLGARSPDAAALLAEIQASLEMLRNQHREFAVEGDSGEHNPDPNYQGHLCDEIALEAAASTDELTAIHVLEAIRDRFAELVRSKWPKRHIDVVIRLKFDQPHDTVNLIRCVPIALVYLALKEIGGDPNYELFEIRPADFVSHRLIVENAFEFTLEKNRPYKRTLGVGKYYFWGVQDRQPRHDVTRRMIGNDPNDSSPVEITIKSRGNSAQSLTK